jgi:peptide/nickel transport system permease protein
MLATFRLSLAAMVMVWLISVPIGIYAAIRQYSLGDKIFSVLAFVGMSLPTFFVAFLLAYLATEIHWLPAGGSESLDHEQMNWFGRTLDTLWHMIIPVSVLTIARIAGMMRLMRGNMLEVKRAQYVTTARAKGLSERKVIYKHMLRNAVNPMVTIFGYQLSGLLSGVALTEAVLGYPGLGRLILDAVMAQDLFLVMASMMMGTTLLLIGNLIADLLLVVVDPRIKVQ